MEFVCKRKVKYEGLETWDGTIEIVSVKRSLIEMSIPAPLEPPVRSLRATIPAA